MPWRPPRHPAAWHGEGCPSLCFQRSPHSCHVHRSVGKSSPHEVIHMEHRIRRILILTRFRASSGCRQSLCLMYRRLEWGFHLRGQQGGRGPGGQRTPGGLLWAPGGPSLAFWDGGSAVPCVLGCPVSSQLWSSCLCRAVSVRGQPENRNHVRYLNRENLIQGIGEAGVGGP